MRWSKICLGIATLAMAGATQLFPQTAHITPRTTQFPLIEAEHGIGPLTGQWRNLTFVDDISFMGTDTARCTALDQWGTEWGPYRAANFYLIAEVIATGEFIQCTYESGSGHWAGGPNGFSWWEDPGESNWFRLWRIPPEGEPHMFFLNVNRSPYVWRATVPEGTPIKLYYGTDLFHVGYQPDGGVYILGMSADNCEMAWTSWEDYFTNGGLGGGVWQLSDPITIVDPQPVGQPINVTFNQYLKKTGAQSYADGVDWLPNPESTWGKWIGLKFQATDAAQNAGLLAYEVFDITTWQGMDMNTPRITNPDSLYHVTGTDRFFDFKVDNPHYPNEQLDKYTITVYDDDLYMEPMDNNGDGRAEIAGATYSTRRYSIVRNVAVKEDTLWLIAYDYAAHAVVMPHGNYCTPLRLRNTTNPINGQPLWAVTVPRDYDGAQRIGINKGDYMADYWEECNAAPDTLLRYSAQICGFYPFYNVDTASGAFSFGYPADRDTLPLGRNFHGDRFCNWEEYRGFHFTGDPITPQYATPTHKSLKPRYKNLIIDWRRNDIDARVKAVIPQFANKLPPLEIYYINAGLNNLDSTRFSSIRRISPNRTGASFDYYSCPQITGDPLQYCVRQNAVSFWSVNRAELRYIAANQQLGINLAVAVGWCISRDGGYGFQVPEIHKRICIWAAKLLTDWRETAGRYYNFPLHQAEWPVAFNQMLVWCMQHEIGHSIAMDEEPNFLNWYMYPSAPIQYDTLLLDYGKFFPFGTVFNYDGLSKSQFTITPKEP